MLERFIFKPSESLQTAVSRSDANPVIEGYEILSEMEVRSVTIIHEHLLSTYHGTAQGAPDIVLEGLGDMLGSAAEFFKELIRRLVEFFKKSALYLTSAFVSFEKFIDKYGDKITAQNKEYSVFGYEYTLDQKVPNTSAMSKIVSEFNNEITAVDKLKKSEIVKRREDFVNEGQIDKLRGQILGFNLPIEADEYKTELTKMFRSGQEEEKEIRVNSNVLKSMIAQYKNTKKILGDVRAERSKIEGVYRSLEAFFAKGTKQRYTDGNPKIVTNKVDMSLDGKSSSVSYTDDMETTKTHSNLDVINYYYSFKWKQAQTIGALSFQAYVERINALKEAMAFYEKTIRRAIFATPEPKEEL